MSAAVRGSPAHAGMHPLRSAASTSSARHPRRSQAFQCRAGSPAHAGMHPSSTAARIVAGRLPRPRGDAPATTPGMPMVEMAPPPTRGCTRGRQRYRSNKSAPPPTRGCTRADRSLAHRPRGSPAHAGMHPSPIRRAAPLSMAPPPTRGCTPAPGSSRFPWLGSPAHAGMHLSVSPLLGRPQRLPRPRGDAPPTGSEPLPREPAPPPTRGCTPGAPGRLRYRAGSPAHAGMHLLQRLRRRRRERLPRPRGDAPSPAGRRGGAAKLGLLAAERVAVTISIFDLCRVTEQLGRW